MTETIEQPPEPAPEVPPAETPTWAEPEPLTLPGILPVTPEPGFVARAPAPEPPPPPPAPATRRVIFFDVENTARTEHIAHVVEHLALARLGRETEILAVGNWRVIGQETARLLSAQGAQLVHSAPSTGVRDWSDLRIAVSAGVWLGGARPGDTLEIVSDDRAFDAVGDVAAALGIGFRRLSYRRLVETAPQPARPTPQPAKAASAARGRGRRGRRRHPEPRASAAPVAVPAPTPVAAPAPTPAAASAGGHTAPHDELVDVVRELTGGGAGGSVTIDTLGRTLKARGYVRPSGSPRLITRLRRVKELSISPNGLVTLVAPAEAPKPEAAASPPGRRRRSSRRRRRRRPSGGGSGSTA